MILVTKTTTGILIQRDTIDIQIDASAVALTLGPIIHELVDSGRALGQARHEGYEDGLSQGYVNALIAQQTSERIADRQAQELVEALSIGMMASAA
jgi:hypothetical protein